MTKWEDLPKKLQELFKDITCINSDSVCAQILRKAMGNKGDFNSFKKCQEELEELEELKKLENEENKKYNITEEEFDAFYQGCWDAVDCQRRLYKDEAEFQREGFQIGSPWHGDILNSPILFLSSNPGITEYCLFPRWHPDRSNPEKDVFSLAGNPDKNKIVKLDYSKVSKEYGDSVEIMKSKYSDNKITPEKVYSFLANRFQESPHAQNSMNVWIKDEKGIIDIRRKKDGHANPVMYWGGMQDVVELLMDGYDVEDSASPQKLLTPVLSAEVVPFGSKREKEIIKDNKIVDYCWKKFTHTLLTEFLRSGKPKIIFLVGALARKAFFRNEFSKKGSEIFHNGTVYPFSKCNEFNYGFPSFVNEGTKCCIVFINSLSYASTYNFQGAVQLLRERAENGDTVIQGAIDDAREMMGL